MLVAHAGLETIWHFDNLGQPLHRIRSCEGLMTTNLVFGGLNNDVLFITESETGNILKAQLPVKGAKMQSSS